MRKHQMAAGLFAAGLFAVGLLILAGQPGLHWANAQQPAPDKAAKDAPAPKAPEPKLPAVAAADVPAPDLSDPAVERFVNLKLVAPAVSRHDAPLLTDLALQLALAESVLDRQHKVFTAKDVATFALAAATETQDKASLDRLAKLATKLNDKELATRISVAKLEASKTRAPEPPTLIPAESVTPGAIAVFKKFKRDLETYTILGNRAEIERRLAEFEKQENLPKELRDQGIVLAKEALATIPKDAKPSDAALAVQRLLDSQTRGH